jgi:hypothetical protein
MNMMIMVIATRKPSTIFLNCSLVSVGTVLEEENAKSVILRTKTKAPCYRWALIIDPHLLDSNPSRSRQVPMKFHVRVEAKSS